MDYGIDRPAELAVEATARPGSQKLYPGGRTIRAVLPGGRLYGGAMVFFRELRHRHHPTVFYAGVGISVYLRGKGCALSRAYWAGILLLLGFGTVFSLFRPSFVTFCTAVFLLLLLTLWAYRTAMDDGKGADPPPLAGGSGAGPSW